MTRSNRTLVYVIGTLILFVAMIFINAMLKKRTVVSAMARTRYAVNLIDGTTAQTNHIPQDVAQIIADKLKESSSIRIFGKKSVCFGIINLHDGDMQPIGSIGVLKYPLFQFDGIQHSFQAQLDVQYNLVGALGFNIQENELQ